MNTIQKMKIVTLGTQPDQNDSSHFVYILYTNGFRYRRVVSCETAVGFTIAAMSHGLDWRELDSMSGVGILA